MRYRHELKFEVSDMELEIIRYRLLPIMRKDRNQEGDSYSIRSLYFDDLQDSRLRENEDGVDNRYKYRIRIYNAGRDVIKLEKKIKFRRMTRKESALITAGICCRYMAGEAPKPGADISDLERELYSEIQMYGMRPKSIVEYERTAFVEPKGNVRITFDRNIRGSTAVGTFLDKVVPGVPLLPTGRQILEVKFDEFLPDYISQAMEIGTLQGESFSKYYYSRQI